MAIDYTVEYTVEGYNERKPTDRPYLDMVKETMSEPMAMSEDEEPEDAEEPVGDGSTQGTFSL